jgi:transposase
MAELRISFIFCSGPRLCGNPRVSRPYEDSSLQRAQPADIGRPAYQPAALLKIYIYGYLNRIQSSLRLEREANRNLELIWLTRRLAPDFKTIADFRRDNGKAIRETCKEFVLLCHGLGLFEEGTVAIDGSKSKAVNSRDENFTDRKLTAPELLALCDMPFSAGNE